MVALVIYGIWLTQCILYSTAVFSSALLHFRDSALHNIDSIT